MLSEELNVSLARITAELNTLRQTSQDADTRAQKAQARVDRLIDRLKAAEVRATTFDRQVAAAERRVLKTVGKALLTGAAGLALSEIGIPEAAAPLVRIGTATIQGGITLGPPGAVVAGAIALAREGIAAWRKTSQELEALKVRQLDTFDRFQQRFVQIERQAIDRDRRIQEGLLKVEERAEAEVREFAYQAARAQALGSFN